MEDSRIENHASSVCVCLCVYVSVCMYVYVHSAKDQMSQELDCILTVSFGEEK